MGESVGVNRARRPAPNRSPVVRSEDLSAEGLWEEDPWVTVEVLVVPSMEEDPPARGLNLKKHTHKQDNERAHAFPPT